jgi:hypothetical protein
LRGGGILRTLPRAISEQWFLALAEEFDHITPSALPWEAHRLNAFARIILHPAARGGKRHSHQLANIISTRLSGWASGRDIIMLNDLLGKDIGVFTPEVLNDDILPEPTRRATLRAVSDGAFGKAARILSEDCLPVGADVQLRLRALPRKDCHQNFPLELSQ